MIGIVLVEIVGLLTQMVERLTKLEMTDHGHVHLQVSAFGEFVMVDVMHHAQLLKSRQDSDGEVLSVSPLDHVLHWRQAPGA